LRKQEQELLFVVEQQLALGVMVIVVKLAIAIV
jgi:hypothetical protein